MVQMLEQLLDSRDLSLSTEIREHIADCKDESLFQR